MRAERATALVLFASTWLLNSPARAQDHLEPETSSLFELRSGHYERAVREQLLPGDVPPYVAAIQLTSFSSEWAVRLDAPNNGKSRLEFRRAKSRIYDQVHEHRKPVAPAVYQEVVRAETADAIARAWETFLHDTRYPPRDDSVQHIVVDGAPYYFSWFVPGQGRMTGTITAAEPCSRTGQLVELLHALRRFAVLPPATRPSEAELVERAQQLVEPAKLDARIAACKAGEASEAVVDEHTRSIAGYLEELAESQYCLCGRWPASASDLKFFDVLTRRREGGDKPYFPDFDFASARLSPAARGVLRIGVRDYERTSEVPECLDPPWSSGDKRFGANHCPEKSR
jgi:hypothetical protein